MGFTVWRGKVWLGMAWDLWLCSVGCGEVRSGQVRHGIQGFAWLGEVRCCKVFKANKIKIKRG